MGLTLSKTPQKFLYHWDNLWLTAFFFFFRASIFLFQESVSVLVCLCLCLSVTHTIPRLLCVHCSSGKVNQSGPVHSSLQILPELLELNTTDWELTRSRICCLTVQEAEKSNVMVLTMASCSRKLRVWKSNGKYGWHQTPSGDQLTLVIMEQIPSQTNYLLKFPFLTMP